MESATQTLHRLTSMAAFDEATEAGPPVDDPRVVQGLVVRDVSRLPLYYKRYPDSLPRIDLPRDLPPTTASALDVLAGTATVPPAGLDLPHLSRLLHLAAGVVRTMERPYGTYLFRAAGSAGGRFPLEIYYAAPGDGVYWYHPQEHALVLIGPAPSGGSPALVVTGIPWRTGWSYRERGYRHVYWDAGTMLSQLLAAAGSAGLTARLHTRFPDEQVAALVGADRIHEWPVAVVALGPGAPALIPAEPAAAGDVDTAPIEFPLVTAAQRAGDQDDWGPAWDPGQPVGTSAIPGVPVEDVILTRGSQRLMDASRSLPAAVLRTCMEVALRGIDVPHWIAVHNVDDVQPGLYRWPGLSAPVRPGDLREDLYNLCMEQGLGRDAAFVVISAVPAGTLDDRQYREAQLAAGLAEGRLHLLAYALNASASGMTFADGLLPALLSEPVDGLLFTCVGTPEYPSRPGGRPGTPTPVRRVVPRF